MRFTLKSIAQNISRGFASIASKQSIENKKQAAKVFDMLECNPAGILIDGALEVVERELVTVPDLKKKLAIVNTAILLELPDNSQYKEWIPVRSTPRLLRKYEPHAFHTIEHPTIEHSQEIDYREIFETLFSEYQSESNYTKVLPGCFALRHQESHTGTYKALVSYHEFIQLIKNITAAHAEDSPHNFINNPSIIYAGKCPIIKSDNTLSDKIDWLHIRSFATKNLSHFFKSPPEKYLRDVVTVGFRRIKPTVHPVRLAQSLFSLALGSHDRDQQDLQRIMMWFANYLSLLHSGPNTKLHKDSYNFTRILYYSYGIIKHLCDTDGLEVASNAYILLKHASEQLQRLFEDKALDRVCSTILINMKKEIDETRELHCIEVMPDAEYRLK